MSSLYRCVIYDDKCVIIPAMLRSKTPFFLIKNRVKSLDQNRVFRSEIFLRPDEWCHRRRPRLANNSLILIDEINEPLTGRKREYHLYPFSTAEMVQNTSVLQETRLLEQQMIYGFYPDIANSPAQAQANLLELGNNYLYKDVLNEHRQKAFTCRRQEDRQ